MKRVSTIAEVRAAIDAERAAGRTIGLVPTMGALHAGHLSLVQAARDTGDYVTMSIFVNPLQFGPGEDFSEYPRTLESDADAAEAAGCDLVFHPSVDEMYPGGEPLTTVGVAEIGDPLEGAGRPGHFDGVATVVAKLFAIFEADNAYFGQKDAQQLAIVTRMARDLSFRTHVVSCPTVREPDGLAMSSRNQYLSAKDRAAAPVIYRALCEAAEFVTNGERETTIIEQKIKSVLASEPRLDVEYATVRDARTFAELDPIEGEVILGVAARIGDAPDGAESAGSKPTRLIDNIIVTT